MTPPAREPGEAASHRITVLLNSYSRDPAFPFTQEEAHLLAETITPLQARLAEYEEWDAHEHTDECRYKHKVECVGSRRAYRLAKRLAEVEAANARWLAWSSGQYPDDSPGDVIHAYSDGTIILDDSITTWNPLRALEWIERRREDNAARAPEPSR